MCGTGQRWAEERQPNKERHMFLTGNDRVEHISSKRKGIFQPGEKSVCAEALDKRTGRSLWNHNRQDKSISDEPLIQRVCGKAPPYSAVRLLV